jgi:hypothetical protein
MSEWLLLAAVLAMLLAPTIVETTRRFMRDRDRLMLATAMQAGGVDPGRFAQAQLGLAFAQALRACRACHHVDECMRWYGDGGERGAPPFCPNREALSRFAFRKDGRS